MALIKKTLDALETATPVSSSSHVPVSSPSSISASSSRDDSAASASQYDELGAREKKFLSEFLDQQDHAWFEQEERLFLAYDYSKTNTHKNALETFLKSSFEKAGVREKEVLQRYIAAFYAEEVNELINSIINKRCKTIVLNNLSDIVDYLLMQESKSAHYTFEASDKTYSFYRFRILDTLALSRKRVAEKSHATELIFSTEPSLQNTTVRAIEMEYSVKHRDLSLKGKLELQLEKKAAIYFPSKIKINAMSDPYSHDDDKIAAIEAAILFADKNGAKTIQVSDSMSPHHRNMVNDTLLKLNDQLTGLKNANLSTSVLDQNASASVSAPSP